MDFFESLEILQESGIEIGSVTHRLNFSFFDITEDLSVLVTYDKEEPSHFEMYDVHTGLCYFWPNIVKGDWCCEVGPRLRDVSSKLKFEDMLSILKRMKL